MVIGRVVGKAVSTAKHASLAGARLLVVEPIRAASLDPVLALDELGAAAGDIVVLSNDGKFARDMVKDGTSPARWWVMGIVDDGAALADRNSDDAAAAGGKAGAMASASGHGGVARAAKGTEKTA